MNNNQTKVNDMIESEFSNIYPYDDMSNWDKNLFKSGYLSATKASEQRITELEEYRDAVLDHFIIAFYGYEDEKTVYENLASLIAYYQEIALDPRVSKEANELHTKIQELQAHVNQLREALETISDWRFGWEGDCGVTSVANNALSSTPAQSLAEHDNSLIERIALALENAEGEFKTLPEYVALVRGMKND